MKNNREEVENIRVTSARAGNEFQAGLGSGEGSLLTAGVAPGGFKVPKASGGSGMGRISRVKTILFFCLLHIWGGQSPELGIPSPKLGSAKGAAAAQEAIPEHPSIQERRDGSRGAALQPPPRP